MEANEIDITGLSAAAVLAALYNNARQQGMGFLHQRGASGMSEAEAQKEIDARTDAKGSWRSYFDYLHGRVMKIDIGGDSLEPYLYDRDNGHGACADAIADLRKSRAA